MDILGQLIALPQCPLLELDGKPQGWEKKRRKDKEAKGKEQRAGEGNVEEGKGDRREGEIWKGQ